jgi:transposase-like protein
MPPCPGRCQNYRAACLSEGGNTLAKRRKFTPGFKTQVVLEELTGVKDKAEICREYRLRR